MTTQSRIGSRSISRLSGTTFEADTGSWVQVDADALPADRREKYMRRREAIELYLSGATDGEIRSRCGMSRSNVYRLIVKRCLLPNADGDLNGWRGALPYERTVEYTRHTVVEVGEDGSGTAGALQWLFASPEGRELEARFRKKILAKPTALESPRLSKQSLFHWLIDELRAMGYERRKEWPFNVEKLGYVTISAHVDKVLAENPSLQRLRLGGEDAQKKAIAGDGTKRPHLAPFKRVECDAHKLDVRMVVAVPSPHGGFEMRKIRRLWVIVLIDVASRAVLGYYLSLRLECSAEDVLVASKRSLSLWKPRTLQFSEVAYVEGAGFPSSVAPELTGACWDELSVDGALANVCHRVERTLKEVVDCRILKPQDPTSYVSRRSKDDRPFIESFFSHLTAGGFHKLAPTTGSNPAKKHGANPAAVASETQFQLEYAEELLDVLIANYNATPHSGLGYRSPLAQLQFLLKQGTPVRCADPYLVSRMVGIRKLCTALGGVSTGRRPYFNFANARYSAEWLALRTDMLGKEYWLQIEDEDDARFATVSDAKGFILGVVRAAPPWHRTPHSLFIRKAIRSLELRRLLHLTTQCDAVEEMIRFAETKGGKLPAHPAYLAARRLLVKYAETLSTENRDGVTPAALPDKAPDNTQLGVDPTPKQTEGDDPSLRDKPTRTIRMAKIW